jgi:chromosome segregation ATPase
MWIWWLISLFILIACFIFAYRMIVSSYEFLPADKRYFWKFRKDNVSAEGTITQKESLKVLRKKIQGVEDYTTFYQSQFTKFQERLKVLEELNVSGISQGGGKIKYQEDQEDQEDQEEDWKEMYYEENEAKQRLENELDTTRQMLEEMEARLKESALDNSGSVETQSSNESKFHEINSLKENNEFLQRQLKSAAERENELERLLMSEITIREKFSLLQKEYVQLQSEADDLRRRIIELGKKDFQLEIRLVHLNELESKLALCEEEKSKLKSRLESHLLG